VGDVAVASPAPSSIGSLPADWRQAIGGSVSDRELHDLEAFVAAERAMGDVYPQPDAVFAALRSTRLDSVRAVILGQDPYARPNQAHGLAFSVPRDYAGPWPGSLRNILAELRDDLDLPVPERGSLEPWANEGVLLLNRVLTVGRGRPGSHRARGWEAVTGAIVAAIAARSQPVIFLLWGRVAQTAAAAVRRSHHPLIETSHPSPLSAHLGFLGSRPFSRANDFLRQAGVPPVDWRLVEAP
jgi:uracil-DNA glycosylase